MPLAAISVFAGASTGALALVLFTVLLTWTLLTVVWLLLLTK